MGFKIVTPPPKASCYCRKPEYGDKGIIFGVGTVWVCDICGSAWKYDGQRSSYNDDYSSWSRASEHDGPDNRPLPTIAQTDLVVKAPPEPKGLIRWQE